MGLRRLCQHSAVAFVANCMGTAELQLGFERIQDEPARQNTLRELAQHVPQSVLVSLWAGIVVPQEALSKATSTWSGLLARILGSIRRASGCIPSSSALPLQGGCGCLCSTRQPVARCVALAWTPTCTTRWFAHVAAMAPCGTTRSAMCFCPCLRRRVARRPHGLRPFHELRRKHGLHRSPGLRPCHVLRPSQ